MVVAKHINIVVYFSEVDVFGYPFSVPEYRESYLDFFDVSMKKYSQLNFFVARGLSYLGDGWFEGGEKYISESGRLEIVDSKFYADVIYNKGNLMVSSNDTANIVNDPKFDRLCKDKMRTALLFPDFSPASIQVTSEDELVRAAKIVHGEKIVIKPVYGQEGHGVKIQTEDEVENVEHGLQEPHIVQEFLDTSSGIEGLVKGVHDLRVLIMNGAIIQSYVRTPKKGRLISNVSKGGHLEEVDLADLPEDILKIANDVDKKLNKYYPRIYSIDFGYTAKGPKIFELNSQPGLPYPQWKKYYRKWHIVLLETLLSSLKDDKSKT